MGQGLDSVCFPGLLGQVLFRVRRVTHASCPLTLLLLAPLASAQPLAPAVSWGLKGDLFRAPSKDPQKQFRQMGKLRSREGKQHVPATRTACIAAHV